MRQLEKRAEGIARARQRSAIERIAAELEKGFGSSRVAIDQDQIRISGRGLVKRWLAESSLRFISGLVK